MSDNELDVPQSQDENSGADGQVDSSGTAVATAADDSEELDPNKDGRNGHQAVGYRTELLLAEDIVNPADLGRRDGRQAGDRAATAGRS